MANSAWTTAALEETAAAASVNMDTEVITQVWRDADCSTRQTIAARETGASQQIILVFLY